MKISVILPTRNNGNRIAATLRHLFDQTVSEAQYEIVAVDNGSTDNTEQILSQLSLEVANLRWIKEAKEGRAHARNRGVAESTGEVILFLDDDIEVEANHLELHLAYHAQSSVPVAVIGKVIDQSRITPSWVEDYFHERQVAGSPGTSRENSDIPLGLYFATGNVSLTRKSLDSIKVNRNGEDIYFDPAFLVREDGDMGCRLVKSGVKFVFGDKIICRHHHPRAWKSIAERSYDGGYALLQLIDKHQEVQLTQQKNVTASSVKNLGLGVACLFLFVPAFLMRPVLPQLMRKIVGAMLAYQNNRGFQQALRDRRRNSK